MIKYLLLLRDWHGIDFSSISTKLFLPCFAELPESWADMREPLLEGMSFSLKYLGMTLVEKPKGEDMAAAAIHRIIAMVKDEFLFLSCSSLLVMQAGRITKTFMSQDFINKQRSEVG